MWLFLPQSMKQFLPLTAWAFSEYLLFQSLPSRGIDGHKTIYHNTFGSVEICNPVQRVHFQDGNDPQLEAPNPPQSH